MIFGKKKQSPTVSSKKKPFALIVDDDPHFNKIIEVVLKKLGIDAMTTKDPMEFLQLVKTKHPDLCIVDLNIGKLGVGFKIVKAVRSVLGNRIPLFVVSGASDQQSIAHAMEIGANDYLVKPVNRNLLASKLSRYVKSEELVDEAGDAFFPVPDGGSPVNVSIHLRVHEIDELGIRLRSKHLITKGTVVHLRGAVVREITGEETPILMTVRSTWIEESGFEYGLLAEFDTTNDYLMKKVRRWLGEKTKTTVPRTKEKDTVGK